MPFSDLRRIYLLLLRIFSKQNRLPLKLHCHLLAPKAVGLFFDGTVDVETGGIVLGKDSTGEVGGDVAPGELAGEGAAGGLMAREAAGRALAMSYFLFSGGRGVEKTIARCRSGRSRCGGGT